ncbi:Calmodulin-dependent protein kinase cmk2 [Candidozyma auris]
MPEDDNETGEDVAVKIILKKALKSKEHEQFIVDELSLLQELKHPHIVGFRDWFESKDKFYLVTQLATGGELFDRIVQQGRFTEHDASIVVTQMLEAIKYLHDRNIVHRDIKPENVLYLTEKPDSAIVLADFGIAKKLQDPKEKLMSSAGSFGYAAPEVITGTGHGKPCDIWSLGVVTYTILCGYSPFRSENVQDFIAEVRHNDAVVFHADYWRTVSKDARRFIIKALQYDPERRATADQLLNDPWLVSIAKKHSDADLLPNLKQNFDARGKFRQAIEVVKLANPIANEEDDDPNEINLFGDEGSVVSDSDLPDTNKDSDSQTEVKTKGGALFNWKKINESLADAENESTASLSSKSSHRKSADKSSLTSSAFVQLVQAATENKERVSEFQRKEGSQER